MCLSTRYPAEVHFRCMRPDECVCQHCTAACFMRSLYRSCEASRRVHLCLINVRQPRLFFHLLLTPLNPLFPPYSHHAYTPTHVRPLLSGCPFLRGVCCRTAEHVERHGSEQEL